MSVDPDSLRDRAERLTTVAEVLEVLEDRAPDANVEHELKEAYASIHVTLGTTPDDNPYAPTYEATQEVQESDHDGRTYLRIPAAVLEPIETERVFIYPAGDTCRLAPGTSEEFVEYKASNGISVQNTDVIDWLDVVPGDRVHVTYLDDEGELRLAAERIADRPDEGEQVDELDLEAKEAEIVAALLDHGECSGPELKRYTGQGSGLHKHLSELIDRGILAKREDPDDARRRLYSLTDDGQARADATDEREQWAALVNGGESA